MELSYLFTYPNEFMLSYNITDIFTIYYDSLGN